MLLFLLASGLSIIFGVTRILLRREPRAPGRLVDRRRRQVVAILGRDGVGKTTLMRSIIGFTPLRRGAVRFKDQDITVWPSFRMTALVPRAGASKSRYVGVA